EFEKTTREAISEFEITKGGGLALAEGAANDLPEACSLQGVPEDGLVVDEGVAPTPKEGVDDERRLGEGGRGVERLRGPRHVGALELGWLRTVEVDEEPDVWGGHANPAAGAKHAVGLGQQVEPLGVAEMFDHVLGVHEVERGVFEWETTRRVKEGHVERP